MSSFFSKWKAFPKNSASFEKYIDTMHSKFLYEARREAYRLAQSNEPVADTKEVHQYVFALHQHYAVLLTSLHQRLSTKEKIYTMRRVLKAVREEADFETALKKYMKKCRHSIRCLSEIRKLEQRVRAHYRYAIRTFYVSNVAARPDKETPASFALPTPPLPTLFSC